MSEHVIIYLDESGDLGFDFQGKKPSRYFVAVADKLTWLEHHNRKHSYALTRTMLYDAVAERLFLNLDLLNDAKRVDVVIDRSKSKSEIAEFNKIVTTAIKRRLPAKAVLTMRHAYSHEEAGIQAIDLFCIGAWREHERSDSEWYTEFQHRVASTVNYQF